MISYRLAAACVAVTLMTGGLAQAAGGSGGGSAGGGSAGGASVSGGSGATGAGIGASGGGPTMGGPSTATPVRVWRRPRDPVSEVRVLTEPARTE